MNRLSLNIRLLIVFGILLIGTVVAELFFRRAQALEYADEMKKSVTLTKDWFSLISQLKKAKGISSDVSSNVANKYMIGNDWSEITTTLGSLEAKETSTNPDFSALMIRLLHEAKVVKGNKVGVVLSGSFPSLAISALAALQTMGIDAVVMSSISASTYGANQPEVTWLDMESELNKKGGLKYRSCLVSMGAGNDVGIGLSAEGIQSIHNAAVRNNVQLYIPESLTESIEKRAAIFNAAKISLLINIGGSQTALGNCPHSTLIPNGLHQNLPSCKDENRGLIARMNEKGVPYIQLLDIKNLAGQYGIGISPGITYAESSNLYQTTRSRKPVLGLILIICLFPIYYLRKNMSLDKHSHHINT